MDKKPIKGEYLDILLRSPKTIFSTKDAALLWGEEREQTVSGRLNKYVKAGKLVGVRRGIYAKDKNYDRFELATRIYIPSYISFETVLAKAGVIFQFYGQIFIASYVTREITADGQTYSYKRIRDSILTNPAGVEVRDNYHIASPERAFLDVVYSNRGYHFDNLSPLNWERVFEILPIYNNKRVAKKINEYYEEFNKQFESKEYTLRETALVEKILQYSYLDKTGYHVKNLNVKYKDKYFFESSDHSDTSAYVITADFQRYDKSAQLFITPFTIKVPPSQIAFHIAFEIWAQHDQSYESRLWKSLPSRNF